MIYDEALIPLEHELNGSGLVPEFRDAFDTQLAKLDTDLVNLFFGETVMANLNIICFEDAFDSLYIERIVDRVVLFKDPVTVSDQPLILFVDDLNLTSTECNEFEFNL